MVRADNCPTWVRTTLWDKPLCGSNAHVGNNITWQQYLLLKSKRADGFGGLVVTLCKNLLSSSNTNMGNNIT